VISFAFIKRLATIMLVAMVLAACGNGGEADPTPTSAPPTAAPGQLTVADVVAMAEPAWPDVRSMRTTSQTGAVPREGEQAAFTGSVQDWTANGDRHLVEFENGTAVNEQFSVDGTVYMRGRFVSSAVAPELDENTWVILDTSVVPADTPVGIQIRYLTRQQADPYGELSDDILSRSVQEAGTVRVGDRTCTMYTFGDENDTGTEIRYELAVDETGLPCQVVQRAGDFQNSTVYEFNTGITIEAPLEGTPVSGTPEG
jgi:hypothetical protein